MATTYPTGQGQVTVIDPNPQLLFYLGRAMAMLESLGASQEMMPGVKEQIDRLSVEVKHMQEKLFNGPQV
jgi:hypothetical protein